MSLKQDVIDVSKQILAEIPFNTIYSYADILFDAKETHFGASSIQNQIDFLKNTTLSDIDYSDIEKNDFFTIKNCRTGKSIRVSNRRATNAELRAHILRALLEQKKQENPNNNLYDAITGALRTAKFSGPVTLLRRQFTLSEDVDENDEPRMSKEHFDLFITILLDAVKEKIKHKTLEENLEPKCIRDSEELLNKIWDGIDVDAIYDATGALTDIFQAIKHKADNLQSRGYQSEANLAYQLHSDLMNLSARLIEEKLSTEDFKRECGSLLESVQNSSLQNHRVFLGMIVHAILTELNVITFCVIRQDEILRNKVSDGINIDDATRTLTYFFQEIKHKADDLQSRGYQSEANLAYQLHTDLMARRARLIEGKLSTQDFKKECRLLLESAQNSSLRNHRDFFGMIFHGILTALNVITFGAISTKPTKSIQTVIAIQANLDALNDTKNEDDTNEDDSSRLSNN